MALSRTDLTVFESEVRIEDRRIAQALGFDRIGNLHRLIQSKLDELEDFGEVLCKTVKVAGGGRGRPSIHYYLNELQATAICLWAETDKGRKARVQIVEVFTAWRKGELPHRTTAISQAELSEPFARLAQRREGIARLVKAPMAGNIDPVLIAALPLFKNERRPKYWYDPEVRDFLISCYQVKRQKDVCNEAIAAFGTERAPSLSSVNRLWAILKDAFGASRIYLDDIEKGSK